MIRRPTCPICEKPLPDGRTLSDPLFPFCSPRCRNVDLLRWNDGQYAIIEPLNPDDPNFDPDSLDRDTYRE